MRRFGPSSTSVRAADLDSRPKRKGQQDPACLHSGRLHDLSANFVLGDRRHKKPTPTHFSGKESSKVTIERQWEWRSLELSTRGWAKAARSTLALCISCWVIQLAECEDCRLLILHGHGDHGGCSCWPDAGTDVTWSVWGIHRGPAGDCFSERQQRRTTAAISAGRQFCRRRTLLRGSAAPVRLALGWMVFAILVENHGSVQRLLSLSLEDHGCRPSSD
jgi:hypothetical protein